MLIETLILALLVSLISGGKLSRLGELVLRGFWLVPLALLIQSGVYWAAVQGIKLGPSWVSPMLDTGSYFLLLIFTLRNRPLPGMRYITLGILLNTLVIGLNGGLMPVDPIFLSETSRNVLQEGQGTHGLMTSSTHLSFLADRFYFDVLGLRKQVFSVGDVLIDIGIFILVFKTQQQPREIGPIACRKTT
ncbi:hypothetical protein E4K67_00440 [Desulfosporosinus fructosivorans]|uniref:DUF5317 domain-containing protein n=1 Tax=Desulfosporosinus fructosivorans TaxID=2018669 RepID=A0A4Z0R9K1_9FIRM|nr:DUF5317 domain-containing protein [Desulfosporosinus fructosivorans]TGE39520.1 hypothetical protein E4K67_00440 [Desulfosporosinus fructosivorans]